MFEFLKGKSKFDPGTQEEKLPTPAPIPREFKSGEFQSGIREKVGFDFREERNQEIEDIIVQLRGAEDDWEKRELLIKLATFLAETEYPDDLVKQSQRANEIMKMVPEKGPVNSTLIKLFSDESLNYLRVKRMADKEKTAKERDDRAA